MTTTPHSTRQAIPILRTEPSGADIAGALKKYDTLLELSENGAVHTTMWLWEDRYPGAEYALKLWASGKGLELEVKSKDPANVPSCVEYQVSMGQLTIGVFAWAVR